MNLSANHADTICRMLEKLTESNWPTASDLLVSDGYLTPSDVVIAWQAVADIAGVDCGISIDDF
jgi:hypothetical protein